MKPPAIHPPPLQWQPPFKKRKNHARELAEKWLISHGPSSTSGADGHDHDKTWATSDLKDNHTKPNDDAVVVTNNNDNQVKNIDNIEKTSMCATTAALPCIDTSWIFAACAWIVLMLIVMWMAGLSSY